MRTTLRLRLPRLAELQPDSEIAFALVEAGQIRRTGQLPLRKVAAAVPAHSAAVAFLHPADANLAEVSIPPLPSHHMAAGVASALEPMLLGDIHELAIAHGARSADGRVPVAWAPRATLAQAWEVLVEHGLLVTQLIPAPLALPKPNEGVVLALYDHHLLARRADGIGSALALDPMHTDTLDEAGAIWLEQLIAEEPAITWLEPRPPWYATWVRDVEARATLESPAWLPSLPEEACWLGELPQWSLALSELRPRRLQGSAWRKPLQWVGAAAAIWLLGLNLYAVQLRGEASTLEQQMTESVRQTLPQLPVILNPVLQATQQRDALLTASGTNQDTDFLPLALAAARLLPSDAQSLQGLTYENGVLWLDLRGTAAAGLDALDPALLARAQELGLQVANAEGGIEVSLQSTNQPGGAGEVNIVPSTQTSRQLQNLTGGNS